MAATVDNTVFPYILNVESYCKTLRERLAENERQLTNLIQRSQTKLEEYQNVEKNTTIKKTLILRQEPLEQEDEIPKPLPNPFDDSLPSSNLPSHLDFPREAAVSPFKLNPSDPNMGLEEQASTFAINSPYQNNLHVATTQNLNQPPKPEIAPLEMNIQQQNQTFPKLQFEINESNPSLAVTTADTGPGASFMETLKHIETFQQPRLESTKTINRINAQIHALDAKLNRVLNDDE